LWEGERGRLHRPARRSIVDLASYERTSAPCRVPARETEWGLACARFFLVQCEWVFRGVPTAVGLAALVVEVQDEAELVGDGREEEIQSGHQRYTRALNREYATYGHRNNSSF